MYMAYLSIVEIYKKKFADNFKNVSINWKLKTENLKFKIYILFIFIFNLTNLSIN